MSSLRQNCLLFCLLFVIVTFSFAQQAFAEELEGTSREEVLTHIQEAFNTQVSLTEKTRSLEEIKQLLSLYFDDELIDMYIDENVQKEDGKYIVYGTDFPMHTIPFFSYNENTKVHEQANERIIYEFFPASTDGPVQYEDHYEVIKLRKERDGWKVYAINTNAKKPEIDGKQFGFISNEKEKKQSEEIKKTTTLGLTQHNSPDSLNMNSDYLKQPIKEMKEVLFFNLFYLQLRNMLNEFGIS